MPRSRAILYLVAVGSLAILLTSVALMAGRIDAYQRTGDRRLYQFRGVDERRFAFAGRAVSLTDEAGAQGGGGVVRDGDDELRRRATIAPAPATPRVPGLRRHEDWLRVLRFGEYGRVSMDDVDTQVRTGQIADR